MKAQYIIGTLVVLCLIFVLVRVLNGGDASEQVVAPEDELKELKERISKVEEYREYYRSNDNNGLTVGGTILEQGIDVLIEVLKQPLVKEFTQKVIQSKEDATFIAEQIETMGKELVSLLKEKQVLRCGSPLVERCEEGVTNEGVVTNVSCRYVESDEEVPKENCKVYRPDRENISYIAKTLYEKAFTIINDDTKRPGIYNAVKNITMSNYEQLHNATGSDEFARKMKEGFPTEEEFFTHFNRMNGKIKLPAAKSVSEE